MRRMMRVGAGVVGAVLLAGLLVTAAEAQRGKRKKAPSTPHSDKIAAALGDLKWGMSKRQLLRYFSVKIRKDYRPKLAKARGAIEEDRLRREMNDKIRAVHESYVEFKGGTTGWDVSFLRDEFTHRNNEAMLVVKDDRAQNFYFLINGKFWKWYRAFNQEVFAGANFEQFAQALQGRYGSGLQKEGAVHEGGDTKRWIEWQDQKTRLRAIDETTFYGFYCLVFEDKATLTRIDELRVHQRRQRDRGHALVESVTLSDDEAEHSDDQNADIVDRITGKVRRRQQQE